MSYLKIKSVEHLKELCSGEDAEDFFVALGVARSSKRIQYFASCAMFDVYNEIDDTWQDDLTEEQLKTETNIVEAIEKGALYKY